MKVLILGLGSIAKKHIAALLAIDESVELFALRSSNTPENYSPVTNLYSTEDIHRYKFDFAIISTPTSEHQKGIELLQSLRCPLFIEKPLFHKLSIKETVDSVIQSGQITYIGCNLRFLDSMLFIKQIIGSSQKRVNEVNVYCGSYLPEWRSNHNFREIYSALPELGGGVHLDLIHEIDYIYWIWGSPINVHRVLSNKSSLAIDAYDYANYCLEYPFFCVNIVLNYYRKNAKRTLEIVFEDQTTEVDLIRNQVRLPDGHILYESDQKGIDTYNTQMKYFIEQAVKQKRNTFNTIQDAYNVLQICLGYDFKR